MASGKDSIDGRDLQPLLWDSFSYELTTAEKFLILTSFRYKYLKYQHFGH